PAHEGDVQVGAHPLEQSVVDRLAYEVVVESIDVGGPRTAGPDELLARQDAQVLTQLRADGFRRQRLYRLSGELQADHRSRFDRRAIGTRQAVQPGFEQGLDRWGHPDFGIVLGLDPASFVQPQRT